MGREPAYGAARVCILAGFFPAVSLHADDYLVFLCPCTQSACKGRQQDIIDLGMVYPGNFLQ